MAFFTFMQAFATLEVVLQFFLENLFLSLKNGGKISLDPLLTSKLLELNPLPAIKLSLTCSFQTTRCSPSIALGDKYSSSRCNT